MQEHELIVWEGSQRFGEHLGKNEEVIHGDIMRRDPVQRRL